jgi:hypothetical protein
MVDKYSNVMRSFFNRFFMINGELKKQELFPKR